MTSSISWIDRSGLAETLARIGVGGGSPARMPRTALGVTKLEPVVDTRPSPVPFEPPAGALRERLEAFLDWLGRLSGSRVVFIVDRDGLPLVDRGADADLLAIASSVMQLVDRMNSELLAVVGQAVSIELEEGQLILLSVRTPIGEYTVGRVGLRSPDAALHRATTEALQAAFQSSDQRASR